jgi:hypothetical protein
MNYVMGIIIFIIASRRKACIFRNGANCIVNIDIGGHIIRRKRGTKIPFFTQLYTFNLGTHCWRLNVEETSNFTAPKHRLLITVPSGFDAPWLCPQATWHGPVSAGECSTVVKSSYEHPMAVHGLASSNGHSTTRSIM